MLKFNSQTLPAMIFGGFIAIIPGGLIEQEAIAAEVYIIDNEAIPVSGSDEEPHAYVSPSDGSISLTLENTSNAVISYLLPNSEYRELQPGESVTIDDWSLPNQIGIQQHDGGLTQVDRIIVDDDGESATIELSYSPTFGASITGITFSEGGAIYLAS
jgi:hypothetical protein